MRWNGAEWFGSVRRNILKIYQDEYKNRMNTLTASAGTPRIEIDRGWPGRGFLDCFRMLLKTGDATPYLRWVAQSEVNSYTLCIKNIWMRITHQLGPGSPICLCSQLKKMINLGIRAYKYNTCAFDSFYKEVVSAGVIKQNTQKPWFTRTYQNARMRIDDTIFICTN